MNLEHCKQHIVTENEDNKRLDSVLGSLWPDISRTYAKKLILMGKVSLDNMVILEPKTFVRQKQNIVAFIPPPAPVSILPQDIPLDIIFEDSHILVINKPINMVVHPAAGNPDKTLVNALLYHCNGQLSGISGEKRPGIVHRLDKNTSGLMVVAKTNEAHIKLSRQFSSRTLNRSYIALAHTLITPARDRIQSNIARNSHNRQKMSVVNHGGKVSITNYEVKKLFPRQRVSLVKCTLETGRTHQIRVHMSHKGWPLVGDTTYGRQQAGRPIDKLLKKIKWPSDRQALHAYKLSLNHPISEAPLIFTAPLPEDFSKLLQMLDIT